MTQVKAILELGTNNMALGSSGPAHASLILDMVTVTAFFVI